MADVKLVKSLYTGSVVTSLGELAAADNARVPGTLQVDGVSTLGSLAGFLYGTAGVVSAVSAGLNRNAIINGAFDIWQRGTATFGTVANATYTADRFVYYKSGTMVHNIPQSGDVPTAAQFGGHLNASLFLSCTTAQASIGADGYIIIRQFIEGYNFRPFVGQYGTLSFWVKAYKAGIYCVYFTNSTSDRFYTAEYTINSSNTWEKKTITVLFDYSGGTWNYTNGIGISISWVVACGSNLQGTANTWNTSQVIATSNQVNGVDSTNDNFQLAGIQFELGSVATPFEFRDIQTELAKCQRYFWQLKGVSVNDSMVFGYAVSTTAVHFNVRFPVPMRALPTMATTAASVIQLTDGVGAALTLSGNMVWALSTIETGRVIITVTDATAFRPYQMFATGVTSILPFSAEL